MAASGMLPAKKLPVLKRRQEAYHNTKAGTNRSAEDPFARFVTPQSADDSTLVRS